MEITNTLNEIFESNGFFVTEDNVDEALGLDSLTFITLVVEIENRFGVNFQGDEGIFLDVSNGTLTFNRLQESISKLLNSSD